MQIELKELDLTNYRNIKHAHFMFDGNSKIVGENRIGKTNTLEAIVWLLTDKLLNGSSDIASIKPLDNTQAKVSVSAWFKVDGRDITIAKEYGEDWVKTRGTNELVLKGHYLNYIYNGVKQKTQRDFYALFKEDFGLQGDFRGIELGRLVIDPFYIGDLGESANWKDLRAFIISLIGDVSDADVFEKNPILMPIKADLDSRLGRIDELKKYYNGESKNIGEQLIGIDAQIDLLEKTEFPNDQEVAIAKKGIQELDQDIAKLQVEKTSDAVIVDIDKQINEKVALMNKMNEDALKNRPEKIIESELATLNQKHHDLLMKKWEHNSEIERAKIRIESLQKDVERCETKRTEYINQLRNLDAQLGTFDAICPTCHRPLEGDELEKAKTQFEANIQFKKDDILKLGKQNKQDKINYQSEIEGIEVGIDMTKNLLNNVLEEIEKTANEIKETNKRLEDSKWTLIVLPPEYEQLEKEVENLKNRKRCAAADNAALDAAVNEKVNDLIAQKDNFQKVLDDFAYAQRQKEQLENIKQTKSDLKKRELKLEQLKELVNLFIKTKLDLLDGRVATIFGNIKFQLIKENLNGGYDPICKPYIYDVDKDQSTNVSWRNGSKSERVITGIAIAECIKRALGLADLPFLFDEGGEISTDTFNTKFKTDSQLICVKVMDNIKTPMVMKI